MARIRNALLPLVIFGCGYASAQSYSIRTVAGGDFVGDGGPASAALLRQLEGVTCDLAGNLYIADTGDNRVRRIGRDGVIQTIAGDGHPGFRGDGGPAVQAQLRSPYGLAADRAGNLYIADTGNGRIRKVGLDGRISTVAGGGLLDADSTGSALDVRFRTPRNVAVDAAGVLYVSDFDAHRVYSVSTGGGLTAVAGTGAAGSFGDGGFAWTAALRSPAGLAIGQDSALYIADCGNKRIRRVLRGIIDTVGVMGMPSWVAPIPLYAPTGVALDASNVLYIADGDQTLRAPSNAWPMQLPGGSRDLVAGPGGAMYTVSGSTLKRVMGQAVSIMAGSAGFGFYGEGSPALTARFQQPSGVAVAADGSWLIADERNNRTRKVDAAGIVTTLAAGPLNAPYGVVADSAGNTFIADTANHRIRKVTAHGDVSTFATLDSPSGLAMDQAGYLYAADAATSKVYKVSPAGVSFVIAGTGERGFDGDGGLAAQAKFDRPRAVAVDASGNVYIADTGNNRIRKVDATGMVVTVMSGLNGPCGVAVDAAGAVYAADTGFHRIRKTVAGGDAVTIAGTAEEGFNGESGAASDVQLSYPAGLAFDGAGNLLICDTGNSRIRMLSLKEKPAVITEPLLKVRVVHAATGQEGPFAPGQIVIVDGLALPPDIVVSWDDAPSAPISSDSRSNRLLIPSNTAGQTSTRLRIGNFVADLALISAAPGIFADSLYNEDGSGNGPSRPAERDSIISFLATGEGVGRLPIAVSISGLPADAVFIGSSPDAPGMLQIRARVPTQCPSGNAGVVLTVGSISSPPVTLSVTSSFRK